MINNTMMNDETVDALWRGMLVIAAVAVFAMLPLEAMAVDKGKETSLDNMLCNVVSFFTGAVGKGIATLALIIVGIGALMGKVSWGMAIIVALGVAVIFGATTLVDALGGGTGDGAAGIGSSNCKTDVYGLEGITQ